MRRTPLLPLASTALLLTLLAAACSGDDGASTPGEDAGTTGSDAGDGGTASDSSTKTDGSTGSDGSTATDSATDGAASDGSTGNDAGAAGTCAVEGEKRCQAGNEVIVETCTRAANGALNYAAAACADNGSCGGAGVCAPQSGCAVGANRCGVNNAVETCVAAAGGNRFESREQCANGCSGSGGNAQCTAAANCAAGTRRCTGNNVKICNAAGTAYLYAQSCAETCNAGLCQGKCTPGDKRCNGNGVEQCKADGSGYAVVDDCGANQRTCDATASACALNGLIIDATATKDYNGLLLVNGALVVKAGQTLTSSSGDLTIRATTITVEAGATITVAATGTGTDGAGSALGNCSYNPGSGGGNGSAGAASSGGSCGLAAGGGAVIGATNDAGVAKGGPGGTGRYNGADSGTAGRGGGRLRLIADTITIAGSVLARGEAGTCASTLCAGGGAGGGVLLAADQIQLPGGATIDTSGGAGGAASYSGGAGGRGRVKLLYGATLVNNATISNATTTQGLLPPLDITSSTHSANGVTYNDDFNFFDAAWKRSFPGRQGYLYVANTNAAGVYPTAATPGVRFVAGGESGSIPYNALSGFLAANTATTVFFRIVPRDANGFGLVENTFPARINTAVPTPKIPQFTVATSFYDGALVVPEWTFPNVAADGNWQGVYFLLDHQGDTMPGNGVASDGRTSVFAPYTQKSQVFQNLADGVWGFHVVTVDKLGNRTRKAAHAVFRVEQGANGKATPTVGFGAVSGKVKVGGLATSNVRVSLNRGLLPQNGNGYVLTAGTGTYDITSVPAGAWTVRAQYTNAAGVVVSKEAPLNVAQGQTTTIPDLDF